jgi:4-hydroxybenzoate polyprenyltransferase
VNVSLSPAVTSRAKVGAVATLLRPHQWLKNAVVLAPLVFSKHLLDLQLASLTLLAVAACCALSSAAYALNDLLDAEADRLHPLKRLRPIASGALSPADGALTFVAAGGLGIALCAAISREVAMLGVGYLVLQQAYTAFLKRVVLLDVIVVATGFILRAYIGGTAIGVEVSPWLVLITFLLALFLALARRKQELEVMGSAAADHRAALGEYTPALLDQMISPIIGATLVAYMIYSVSPEVAGRLGTPYFHLTVPFVVFGLFRYLYLVHQHGAGEDPSRLLVSDAPLLASVMAWGIVVLLLLYGHGLALPLRL